METKPNYSGLAGPIGHVSARLGTDLRDIWMLGYSDEQISGVLAGKYTLEELYKMEPLGNDRTPYGQEILAGRRKA